MKKSFQIVSFVITFFLLVAPVFAQALELGDWFSGDFFWQEVLALPSDWQPNQNLRNFVFNFLVPFIALYAIILGILRNIGIFRMTTGIEAVVAFAMAFMTLPSRIFLGFVQFTLGVGGIWAYLLFLVMLFGGGGFYAFGFVRRHQGEYTVYTHYKKQLDRINSEMYLITDKRTQLMNQLGNPNLRPAEINSIKNKIDQLTDLSQKLELQRDQLKQAYQSAKYA